MSAAKRLRKKVDYELDVPRCANCASYRKGRAVLTTNSMTRWQKPWCVTNEFQIHEQAVCNLWTSKKGEKLLS